MRDLNKSNGRAMLNRRKRSGETAPAMGVTGLAKSRPVDTASHTPHGQACAPVKRIAPTSDFEGFGSFSS
ncbi:hypothetical protein MPPM_4875 [Methylorubrum populi]|uniref:Uncharacterized protein n=1 Tax=Methylorubrum populi TaxID=223967 RepID=A0A160PN40_9HYPH|nr:hypothetical protein MPPM_4875 [Methylorubrum populi]